MNGRTAILSEKDHRTVGHAIAFGQQSQILLTSNPYSHTRYCLTTNYRICGLIWRVNHSIIQN